MRAYGRWAAAALLASALACGADEGVTGPAPVAAVQLATTAVDLVVGEATTLVATPVDPGGAPLAGRAVRWTTDAAAVVGVDAAGRVVARAVGTAHVYATSEGKVAQATITVSPVPVARIALSAAALDLVEGETAQLVATPLDAEGQPIAGLVVQWAAAGADAATVSAAGLVTARAMGFATIAASVNGVLAQATVRVLGRSPVDLVFDRWTVVGGLARPQLARLDLRAPDAVPTMLAFPAEGAEAAPSPDGTRIAYACGSAICVADADGSDARVLTASGTLLADAPAWSPDGAHIAFRGWAPGGPPGPFNPSRIWIVNPDGSGGRRLTSDDEPGTWEEAPTWSPRLADGAFRIAYSRQQIRDGHAVGRIASVRTDGGEPRLLTADGGQLDDEPAWSPDGATIAFTRTGGEASGDLWLVAADGGAARPLMAADPAGAQRGPAWSPDGTLLAFASSHDLQDGFYTWQIFTVRADGTGLARRTHDAAEKRNPAWLRR